METVRIVEVTSLKDIPVKSREWSKGRTDQEIIDHYARRKLTIDTIYHWQSQVVREWKKTFVTLKEEVQHGSD